MEGRGGGGGRWGRYFVGVTRESSDLFQYFPA